MQRHLIYLLAGLVGALAILLLVVRPALAPLDFNQPGSGHVASPLPPEFQPSPLTSFSQLWATDPKSVATMSAERVRTLIVTGDVLPARDVNAHVRELGDFTWPWLHTAERLRQADITYINLETPLVADCPTRREGMVFCGDLRHIEGLQFAGVDVVNLANNHMGNFNQSGVDTTVQALNAAGLATPGVHDPVYVEVRGQKWAFLGYNEVDQQVGIQLSESELIRQQVTTARAQADIVIVQFHWGVEYRYNPTAHQQQLAQLAIDAGADLVIGNHPHWFQPIEFYKGKLITYSHGNFIFDQMWSRETREGLVGKYTFYDTNLVAVEYWPVWIEPHGQPRWLEGEEKDRLTGTLKRESELLIND